MDINTLAKKLNLNKDKFIDRGTDVCASIKLLSDQPIFGCYSIGRGSHFFVTSNAISKSNENEWIVKSESSVPGVKERVRFDESNNHEFGVHYKGADGKDRISISNPESNEVYKFLSSKNFSERIRKCFSTKVHNRYNSIDRLLDNWPILLDNYAKELGLGPDDFNDDLNKKLIQFLKDIGVKGSDKDISDDIEMVTSMSPQTLYRYSTKTDIYPKFEKYLDFISGPSYHKRLGGLVNRHGQKYNP